MRAILVVLMLCVAACAQTIPGQAGTADVLSFQRPGHSPNGPAVGDYGGLVSRPGGAPVRYRGVPVVQACDLLTPEDISGLGLVIAGGIAAGMVGRHAIAGAGDVGPYDVASVGAPTVAGTRSPSGAADGGPEVANSCTHRR